MDEEWRVSLVNIVQLAGGKVSARALLGLLRNRGGADASVTGGKSGIFLYAATEDAAAAAEGIAREVLAQQGLTADIHVERWDPSRRSWLPPGGTPAAELPSEQERSPGRKHLNAAGTVIAAILDGIGNAGP